MAEIQLDTLAWARMLSQKKAAARENAAREKVRTKSVDKPNGTEITDDDLRRK